MSRSAADARSRERPQLNRWVYEQLRDALVTGRFVPGRAVTLRGVATEFGVSLMPVREALRQLVAERALVMYDNRRIGVPEMSPAHLDELCRARMLVEPELAVRALPECDAAMVEKLRRLDREVDLALEHGKAERYMRCNYEFHLTLYRAAPSEVLLPIAESLWLQVGPFLRMIVGRLGTASFVDRHQAALSAIVAGDGPALREAIAADIGDGLAAMGAAVIEQRRRGAAA
jgi:DNA-binding GntR family transcriptional regulator